MVKNCVSHISPRNSPARQELREDKNFSVILDIIYWFIIITENEMRSKAS